MKSPSAKTRMATPRLFDKAAFKAVPFMALAFAIALSAAIPAHGRRTSYRIPMEKFRETHTSREMEWQTDSASLADAKASIIFSGYDKRATSSSESLFAENNSSRTLDGIRLELEYLSMDGRQLHRREVEVRQQIPASERRKLDFKSWDRQGAFYYHRSQAPRSSATPYKVNVRLTGVAWAEVDGEVTD